MRLVHSIQYDSKLCGFGHSLKDELDARPHTTIPFGVNKGFCRLLNETKLVLVVQMDLHLGIGSSVWSCDCIGKWWPATARLPWNCRFSEPHLCHLAFRPPEPETPRAPGSGGEERQDTRAPWCPVTRVPQEDTESEDLFLLTARDGCWGFTEMWPDYRMLVTHTHC